MGWKATKEISREDAITLIINRLYDASADELSLVLESLGFGESSGLPYYGYNFSVKDYRLKDEIDENNT